MTATRDDRAIDPGRRAAATVLIALLALYLASLAPRVTFWDAGEFIAAIESFGIPHPPGTPLYVMLGRTWRLLLAMLPPAVAVNSLSAVCTAAACAIAASVLALRTGSTPIGIAAGLCAGCMSSVWLDATEAEVYSAALLLSALMLAAGLSRRDALVSYLFALAAPLHPSALVAGPAALFAAVDESGEARRSRIERALVLGAALVAAGSIATGRWWLGGAALLALLALAAARRPEASSALLLVALGVSPLIVMLARARFDPAINQGNPATLTALADVIARRQYEIASILPRQAPPWMQLANFFQYADWQFALGVAPESTVSVPRLFISLAFVAMGVVGLRAHRARDRRSWRVLVVLFASASLGVIGYLNLKAGPSIGWGVLPDAMPHEARERDYFFALAFWCWGLWCGIGAVTIARRISRARAAAVAGVALAALPALLNWRAMDRRREPDASTAALLAETLLSSAPPAAVLVVWGDNDTYPLWYAQQALGTRRDVLVVTSPLLGAPWIRAELLRRDSIDPGPLRTERAMVAATVASARAARRPVAFAVTVPAEVRAAAGGEWRLCGAAWIATDVACSFSDSVRVARFLAAHPPSRFTDNTVRVMSRSLRCAVADPAAPPVAAAVDSLAQICNVR